MLTSASRSGRLGVYAASAAISAAALIGLREVPAITGGAAAPLLLLIVLIIARTWGTGPAITASGVAALGYSYYFLPPLGFGLANPNDWVAFLTFTFTAI